MNAKADTPKSAYPLNKQYKKYCIRCIPTLAYPNQVTGPDHLVCSQPAVGKLPIYSLVRFHRTIPAKHTVNYYLMFHLRHSH